MIKNKIIFLILTAILNLIVVLPAYANNLNISNVQLGNRNPSENTIDVSFDVSWENAWKTKINHDAVWVTFRLSEVSNSSNTLCELSGSGKNPSGFSVGSNSALEIFVPSDKKGLMIRPETFGIYPSISSTKMVASVNYASCGFTKDSSVKASVIGVEMAYVPQGAFYAGDFGNSTGALVQGVNDNEPWYISANTAMQINNANVDGFRYVSTSKEGEDITGASFVIGQEFPKGFTGFYVMKYEANEGLWTAFVNSLPAAARENHDLTDNDHKGSDAVKFRNTINCSGSPLVCVSQRPSRPVSYLSWVDLSALLDWLALRPMTELEFEKTARGPELPVVGEYSWGNNTIHAATTITDGEESGEEIVTNSGANAIFAGVSFNGGDSTEGAEYQKGPLRNGIFANADTNREQAGASYYGVLDLSGNLSEMVVSVGSPYGRAFAGTMGDGVLSFAVGYEGYANQADWPGIDDIASYGVTGGEGSGFRGGSWDSASDALRISDRSEATINAFTALSTAGGRGVRNYEN